MGDESRENAQAPALRPELREPQLPVLRYSLRHMFWSVTLVCVVLTAVVSGMGSGFAPLAILLVVLVVALHVAGTAIGTRLREHADERQAWEAAQAGVNVVRSMPASRPSPLQRRGLPMPWVRMWVAVGIIGGGAIGAVVLAMTIGHRTSAVGIAVGALSTAILGGWFAFVAASFWAILRQGWQEAVDDHHENDTRDANHR